MEATETIKRVAAPSPSVLISKRCCLARLRTVPAYAQEPGGLAGVDILRFVFRKQDQFLPTRRCLIELSLIVSLAA